MRWIYAGQAARWADKNRQKRQVTCDEEGPTLWMPLTTSLQKLMRAENEVESKLVDPSRTNTKSMLRGRVRYIQSGSSESARVCEMGVES
jgi:hypothetical protein